MKLTEHFYLSEIVATQHRHINNDLPEAFMPNARRLAATLERVRLILGAPVLISSGYRCAALNKAVGGSHNSDHLKALAADFTAPGFGSPYHVCLALLPKLDDLGIGQLIHEFGRWVHIGIGPSTSPINRMLTIDSKSARSGIHKVLA